MMLKNSKNIQKLLYLIKNYIDKSYDEIYNFLNNYLNDPNIK